MLFMSFFRVLHVLITICLENKMIFMIAVLNIHNIIFYISSLSNTSLIHILTSVTNKNNNIVSEFKGYQKNFKLWLWI